VATVFASVYKDKPWVGVLSYGIATGVALSRLNDDKHWASDVFIGAALGFAGGKNGLPHHGRTHKSDIGSFQYRWSGFGVSFIKAACRQKH